jgi:signal-transduction protein with cAMP-binding, CBS, and nucleotidyltransferase domain
MNELDSITILKGESIYKAIEKITKNRKQFILVTNDSFKLLGIVTDGDIRRGVLKGVTLDECVEKIMNPDPFKAKVEDTKEKIFDNMKANSLHQCRLK